MLAEQPSRGKQEQDAAFQTALAAAIAAGHEQAVTGVSTAAGTKAPRHISANQHRIVCK